MDPLDWFEIFSDFNPSGQYSGDRVGDRLERHSSVYQGTDYESEDIDYAVALSLQEHDLKGENRKPHEGRSREDGKPTEAQLVEDGLLAMALQESLSMEPESSLQNNRGSSHRTDEGPPFLSSRRCCRGCKTRKDGEELLTAVGAVWHPDCFRCRGCDRPITDLEFSVSKSENRPYHKSCYKEIHHTRCYVCNDFLPLCDQGVEYKAHPFWMVLYCPSHEQDGSPRCCSCCRIEPKDTKYLELDDVRKLCLECLSSAVTESHECQPLYREVQKFFERLNMKVDQQIQLILVERQALNEAVEKQKNGHHNFPEEIETRGICLFERPSIPLVWPGVGESSCEVTAILILCGLPRLLTGSIIAHEMMHAWLRLRGFSDLNPKIEEGICQVLAHRWLEHELDSISGRDVGSSSSTNSNGEMSEFEKQLGKFFMHQIESDKSPIYGEGFRLGYKAVSQYGLETTLDYIRTTHGFP